MTKQSNPKAQEIKGIIYEAFLNERNKPLSYPSLEQNRDVFLLYSTVWKELGEQIKLKHGEDTYWDFIEYARENKLSVLYRKKAA